MSCQGRKEIQARNHTLFQVGLEALKKQSHLIQMSRVLQQEVQQSALQSSLSVITSH